MQRNEHYPGSRMVLREKPESVKFMLIVTDPPNVSTREMIKVSREFTEITPLSLSPRAPLELVLCRVVKASDIESDQGTCAANASKQNVDCRDR